MRDLLAWDIHGPGRAGFLRWGMTAEDVLVECGSIGRLVGGATGAMSAWFGEAFRVDFTVHGDVEGFEFTSSCRVDLDGVSLLPRQSLDDIRAALRFPFTMARDSLTGTWFIDPWGIALHTDGPGDLVTSVRLERAEFKVRPRWQVEAGA